MKNYSKILTTLVIAFVLFFGSTLHGTCENGYNRPLGGGVTAEFAPDAVGTYTLNYSAVAFYDWQLIVKVYWQSDTYPGWHEFYVRSYLHVNYASDSVVLYSGTDDNIRYRVEFWTNSFSALGSWTFS